MGKISTSCQVCCEWFSDPLALANHYQFKHPGFCPKSEGTMNPDQMLQKAEQEARQKLLEKYDKMEKAIAAAKFLMNYIETTPHGELMINKWKNEFGDV